MYEPSAEERGHPSTGVPDAVRKFVLRMWGNLLNEHVKLEERVIHLEDDAAIRNAAVDEVADRVLAQSDIPPTPLEEHL